MLRTHSAGQLRAGDEGTSVTLAGWVVSRIDPAMLAPEDNIDWLAGHLGAPLLADLARLTPREYRGFLPKSPETAAQIAAEHAGREHGERGRRDERNRRPSGCRTSCRCD